MLNIDTDNVDDGTLETVGIVGFDVTDELVQCDAEIEGLDELDARELGTCDIVSRGEGNLIDANGVAEIDEEDK